MAEQQASSTFAAQDGEPTVEARVQQIEHPEVDAAVRKIQNGLNAKVDEIEADATLDAAERYHRKREQWDKATNVYGQVMEVYGRQLEEESAQREQGVFSIPPSMRDSVRSAYNDVYDRTEHAWSSGDMEGISHAREEMERLWERAIRTGDRALQAAIGHLATERGVHELRDKWLATSEEKSRAWGRYVEARSKLDDFNDPHQKLRRTNMTGEWALIKPPEA